MVALVESIARALADEPEAVRVSLIPTAKGGKIELRVGPDDVGKIVGRQGRTAKALRALLAAAGRKTRRSYSLEIVEMSQ